jgi:hypothetical protein
MHSIHRVLLALSLLTLLAKPPGVFADAPDPKPFLLHLPGIGGERFIDHRFIAGLKDGGFNGNIQIYDWTEKDPGLNALLARQRNNKEAKIISQMIQQERAANPQEKIFLTTHSAGAGLGAWALEALPDDVKIDTMVMMSPALSPTYDLSPALKHIAGHLYVFTSLADIIVLSTGTKLFGTIDGVKTDAAGRVGFTTPPGADAAQYAKVVQLPYDPSWIKYNDFGDHIGGLNRSFAKNVIVPLILEGKMPAVAMPTTAQTPAGLQREMPH